MAKTSKQRIMKIEFKSLSESHFPLMLKWLKTPHVKLRWDREISYTEDLVKEKYTSYVNGYKLENGEKKPISAFVIYVDNNPIGYIQIYKPQDFTRTIALENLPEPVAAIDFFIGGVGYVGKGLGVEILKNFDYQGYKNILVNVSLGNIAAIKTYEKASFKKIKEYKESNEILMLKENL